MVSENGMSKFPFYLGNKYLCLQDSRYDPESGWVKREDESSISRL